MALREKHCKNLGVSFVGPGLIHVSGCIYPDSGVHACLTAVRGCGNQEVCMTQLQPADTIQAGYGGGHINPMSP